MNFRLIECSFFSIFIVILASACQSVQTSRISDDELLNHWYHFSEEDNLDTLVFVHHQQLKTVRGGRINFELFKDETMTWEEAMSNDKPAITKGNWKCDSNTNTLTFTLDNLTKHFLIISLKNNKLKVKQISR